MEGLRFTGMIIFPKCCSLTYFSFRLLFCIIAKAVAELVRFLLRQPGVQYVLTAKLSQDSLESFFGKQRMRGGYSDNPNVTTFLYGAQSLRVQGSTAVKPTRGNCKRGRNTQPMVVDEQPLPKRRRSSHKNK